MAFFSFNNEVICKNILWFFASENVPFVPEISMQFPPILTFPFCQWQTENWEKNLSILKKTKIIDFCKSGIVCDFEIADEFVCLVLKYRYHFPNDFSLEAVVMAVVSGPEWNRTQ